MKRLLLFPFLITLLISSCSRNKYNSAYEAEKACEKWMSEGFEILFRDKEGGIRRGAHSRYCFYEGETR